MSVHYDKIHDIRRLIKLCQTNSIELPNQIEDLVNLNPYAGEGRYGVIADDMYDAQTFIDLLQKVKSHVANKIGKVVACTNAVYFIISGGKKQWRYLLQFQKMYLNRPKYIGVN